MGAVYFQFTKGHGFGQLMGICPVRPAECALLYHRGQVATRACYCALDDCDQQYTVSNITPGEQDMLHYSPAL